MGGFSDGRGPSLTMDMEQRRDNLGRAERVRGIYIKEGQGSFRPRVVRKSGKVKWPFIGELPRIEVRGWGSFIPLPVAAHPLHVQCDG
jgi:hypothetical protein